MINRKIRNILGILKTRGVSSACNSMLDLCDYTFHNLSQLDNINNYYWAGSIFAITCYERIDATAQVPRLAYYCLTQDTKIVEPENMGKPYNLRSTVERLQLVMRGGLRLVREKAYLMDDMSEEQAISFSIMSDVLKLQRMGFSCNEQWWNNAVLDLGDHRGTYASFSDDDIISEGEKVHFVVADAVRQYLEMYVRNYM